MNSPDTSNVEFGIKDNLPTFDPEQNDEQFTHLNSSTRSRAVLIKKSTSQEGILHALSRNVSCDTPDDFLKPQIMNKLTPQVISVESELYKCLPSATPKFFGVKDEYGQVIKRRLVGGEDLFEQEENRYKLPKGFQSKQTKINISPFTKSKAMGRLSSMQTPGMENEDRASRATSKQGIMKRYMKLPDNQAKEMIQNIVERVTQSRREDITSMMLTGTSNTSLSRVSTVGGFLKEIKQERVLVDHDRKVKEWDQSAVNLSIRVQKDRQRNKIASREVSRELQSVMMRDQAFIQKQQEINATSHLRDMQNVNDCVGWVFSLRRYSQNPEESRSSNQQYLPSRSNGGTRGINAIIVPKARHVPELFAKPSFEDAHEAQIEQEYMLPSISHSQLRSLNTSKTGGDLMLDTQRTEQVLSSEYQLSTPKRSSAKPSTSTSKFVKTQSEPKFKNWESYQKTWKSESKQLQQVMMNTNLDNLKTLKIQGIDKLREEIKTCMKIPSTDRRLLMNHHFTEDGEGEPYEREEIEKSPKDLNRYEVFTLENGLQCMLIQDNNQKTIDKGGNMASMSLAVNAGCFNDPMSRQGLAHFLEHMIFMGSSKYPDENAFANHIAAHGGYTNAYTEMELTNYQLKVDYKGLFTALDMFAWLLADPLLKDEAQEREIKSIESEFEVNYPYDGSRMFQLLSNLTSDKKHILNRFTWGNMKSLQSTKPKQLIDDVKKFYLQQYSADRMKLVIQVKTEDDLKELKEQVEKIFSVIPNRQLGYQNFSVDKQGKPIKQPYEGNLDQMVVFNSVKQSNGLSLNFTLPFSKQDAKTRSQILHLISQVIAYEGKSSLYNVLKEQGLILSLKGREDFQFKTTMTSYELKFSLTEKGIEKYIEVLAMLQSYIGLFQNHLQSIKSFEEFDFFRQAQQLSEIGFMFYKVPDPLDNVCDLASEMLFTPDITQILKHTYNDFYLTKINIKDIIAILSLIRIENAKIVLKGKNILQREQFKAKVLTEKWFKTKYSIIPKPSKEILTLADSLDASQLRLPQLNPLMPENFLFKSEQIVEKNPIPQLIDQVEGVYELWHHQDRSFQMPRAIVQIIFMCEGFFNTPKNRAYWSVYTDSLIEKITSEIGFEATQADIGYSIKGFEDLGFKLKFQGYNDKLSDFIKIFLKSIAQVANEGLSENLIKTSQEKSIKNYKNINVEVDQKTTNNRLIYLLRNQYHAKQIIQELEALNIEEMNKWFVQRVVESIKYVKVFVAGNMVADEAKDICKAVLDNMKIDPKVKHDLQQLSKTRVRAMKEGEKVIWDSVHYSQDQTGEDSDSENQSMEDLTGKHSDEEDSNSEGDHSGSQHDEEGSDDGEDSEEGKDKKENNSCIQIYFQSPSHTNKAGLMLQVLEAILEDWFYDELRNKEQLGYYVAVSRRCTRGLYGMLFTVESASHDPLQLQEKIYGFIDHAWKKLCDKEEGVKIYQTFLEGLIARKREGFTSMKDETSYYLNQMKEFQPENSEQHRIHWNRVERDVEILQDHITREEVLNLYEEILMKKPRTAIFRVFAEKHKELAQNQDIENQVLSGSYLEPEQFGETESVMLDY